MPVDPRYKALLIGNGSFAQDPHTLRRLHGPANDVPLLRAALTHPEAGLFAPDNVRTLIDGTQRQVLDAIEQFFREATGGEHLLLYYSGHGCRSERQRNFYLCTSDTRSDRLGSTAISDKTINEIAGESLALKYIFVLDCCHSGGFKGGQMGVDLGVGSGRCLITSCTSDDLSADAPEGSGASAFTRVLAEALTSGEVDADGDGKVLTRELYNYVQPRVYAATRQTVQISADPSFGEAAVACAVPRATARQPAPPPPPPPPERERPVIELSESTLDFPDVPPGEKLRVERIDVVNIGGGTLDWFVESDDPWLKAERKGDSLLVTLDTAQPGLHRGKLTVRDRNGATPKTVRVLLRVLERKSPAPPPAPPEPPPIVPPPNIDAQFVQALQGWWMNNAGAIRIRREGGALVLHDFNLVGLQVGQGAIHVQNNMAHVQGMNSMAGPYSGQLAIQGNMLSASLMVGGQMTTVMFMRQQPWFAGFAG